MIELGLLLAAVVAPPAERDPVSKLTDRRQSEYRTCIGAAALKMSRSHETAPVVAKASLMACLSERDAFEKALSGDITKISPQMTEEKLDRLLAQFMTKIDRNMRDYATYVATDARSGKQ